MAMVFELGVPKDDLAAIAVFMRTEGNADIPRLGELGAKVLSRMMQDQQGFWHVEVGRFVDYTAVGDNEYLTPDGERVTHADSFMGERGNSTRRWGQVVTDYEEPVDAYEIGTPL